jgi:hypothetical protein
LALLDNPHALHVSTVSAYEWTYKPFQPFLGGFCTDVESAVVIKPKCQYMFYKIFRFGAT